jgi:FKBP-type peptidyl-prolyl cis-trans isomerase
LAAIATLLLASCSKPYKKSPDGSEYKVIGNDKGKKAINGGFIQLNILVKYKDSILFNTAEQGSPKFIPFDTARLPEFFKNIHEGDSIIIKTATDTLIKANRAEPYMKKGQFVFQYLKVAKVFATREEAEIAAKAFEAGAKALQYKKTIEQIEKNLVTDADQMKKDDVIITDYLAKNNIKATKTKWGTYVAIVTPGTGANLTEKEIAKVNYTGRNLKDSVFDSNTDPRFDHLQPYNVKLNEFSVIPGWIDGIKMLQKGSVAKLIIPSSLAYGKEGKGGNIGPNEVLIFDITVLDTITEAQYEADQQAMQQQMMERQTRMREEMMKKQKEKAGNTAPKDAEKK